VNSLFFLITDSTSDASDASNLIRVVSWCHNLTELFSLIERVYKVQSPVVYRYMPQNKVFDIRAAWNKKELQWKIEAEGEIGLQRVDLNVLRTSYLIIKGKG
jgi:hypothetical protein